MEIIEINGTKVGGAKKGQIKDIFNSATDEISIVARIPSFKAMARYEKSSYLLSRENHGDMTYHARRNEIVCKPSLNFSRNIVPPILASANVSKAKWIIIYDLITKNLVPATQSSVEMDEVFRREMSQYTTKQFNKALVQGRHWENKHEVKCLRMTHHCAMLNNNATLVATNVLAAINSILASGRHDVVASLALFSESIPNYSTKQYGSNMALKPCGVEFSYVS